MVALLWAVSFAVSFFQTEGHLGDPQVRKSALQVADLRVAG
jgi:hypothetical protein